MWYNGHTRNERGLKSILSVNIETERLIFRRMKEEDAELCFSLWLDEEMGKYMADPPRELADEQYLNFAKGIETDESWYPFVVFSKETGEFVGTCSFIPMIDPVRWDLGYAIHKKFWRQGYATEMVSAVINFGLSKGVRRFSAKVAQENAASNALMRKLGFVAIKEGTYRKQHTDIVYDDYTYQLERFNILTVNIETERLIIRRTREEDAALCLDMWLDDETGKYMTDPPREKADEGFLNFAKGIEADESWLPLVAFSKETGAFIGTCSVFPYEDPTHWELGYTIHKDFWRRGFATEMVTAVIDYGYGIGVRTFTADVAQENTASNALSSKLGFVVVGEGSFRKKNTDITYSDYTYQLDRL